MINFDPERDPMDLLAEEFTLLYRHGERPSVAAFAEQYPEWADQIRDLLPSVARMEELRSLRQSERGTAADGVNLRQVGDYRILREVGRGGMGIVYEAVQESLGRRVALKVLPKHSLLDPKNLERFRREAQAAAQLHHTNIVPVFGVGEQDGLHYYVMQFIPGQGLNEILAEWREEQAVAATRIPPGGAPDCSRWQPIAEVGVQVAEALHYAHQHGTLHRDIKPANLLLDDQGTVWVTDFGLAKSIPSLLPTSAEGNKGGGLTNTGDIVGTLQYLAPEGFGGQIDARSDVYSLGLTLYELLTLAPPFSASNPAELLQQVSEQEPPPPRKVNPAIPRDLETIILKATAREPNHRYPTAGELAEDLKRFLGDRPIQARRATLAERLGRWCRRNRAIASLVLALVVVFLSGFAAVVWKWQEAATERQRAEHNLSLATNALHRESQHRAKAEAATQRAEANVSLSLAAFGDIFNQMSRREQDSPFYEVSARERPWLPVDAMKAREDAALLESILRFYDQFAEQNVTNPDLQLEAAKAYRRIRDIQQWRGQVDRAEVVDQRAIAILEKLTVEFPSVSSYRYELAKTYAQINTQSTEPGVLETNERRLHRALEIQGELTAAFASSSRYRASLACMYGKLGEVLRQRGRPEEAERAYGQAVTYLKSLVGDCPAHSLYLFHLSTARRALADLLVTRNRLAEARSVLEESIADLQKVSSASPRFRSASLMLAADYRSLATILGRMGETRLAEAASHKAKQLGQNLPGFLARSDSKLGPRHEVNPNALNWEWFSSEAERHLGRGRAGGTGSSHRTREHSGPGQRHLGMTPGSSLIQK
jgi:serine/threonine protein kinase